MAEETPAESAFAEAEVQFQKRWQVWDG